MNNSSYIFNSILNDLGESAVPGFHIKTHGRGGFIYYVEDEYIIPIAIEMPGVDYLDILVFGETEHIKTKYYLKSNHSETLILEERFRIQNLLVKWLEQKGKIHDIQIGK
ncbi:hypothetical protein GXP70_07925 [Paenibacillus lycopersici]|uniref:Uncharacterized protein n=1 Tax=Paenibacillus lycopersici TaxID=2704462 RepID=A0A6C0G4P6_9BACL|nr:hypothetical protein [Paenibacillus lycopersici]QHT59885.1 hypothetical protein GXP70_07925 [Paenibacillus lycopersici]